MPKKRSNQNASQIEQGEKTDNLLRQRDTYVNKLDRFKSFLQTLQTSPPNNSKLIELDTRLKDLERNLLADFNIVQFELEGIDFETYKEDNENSFEGLYYSIIADAKNYLFSFSSSPQNNAQNLNAPQPNTSFKSVKAKLPVIELPKFSGVYEKWLEFKELYISLIHNANDIDLVQKFHYLRASLEGHAAHCIQHINISGANYEIAWNVLCERFDNKRLMVHNHLKALFNIPDVKPDSASALRNLIDSLSKNLRSLETSGVITENWDPLIIYMFTKKFDLETIREWEHYKTENDLPTINELKTFLASRADFLEKVNMHKPKLKNTQSFQPFSNHSNKFKSACLSSNTSASHSLNDSDNMHCQPLSKNKYSCYSCKKPHPIYKCPEFLALSVKDRIDRAKYLKLCLNCLQKDHVATNCRYGSCKHCKNKHNSLLHLLSNEKSKETSFVNLSQASSLDHSDQPSNSISLSNQVTNNPENTITCNAASSGQVLLATALIEVADDQGHIHTCRALLDSASMSNFITQELAQRLNLVQESVDITVTGIDHSRGHVSRSCQLQFKSINSNFKTNMSCLIVSTITDNIPSICLNPRDFNIPSTIKLADPTFFTSTKIDLLIGAGLFWKLLCKGTIPLGENKPILQKSQLGWYISGPFQSTNNSSIATYCHFSKTSDIQTQLSRFWEIEEIPSKPIYSNEEQQAELHFQNTFKRNEQGRYVVSIPLKETTTKLGDSKDNATKQFFSLEKRLAKTPKLNNMYHAFMSEYIDLKHMSLFQPQDGGIQFYSPHHGVVREESETTKLRVVFNSSFPSSSGFSYNSLQMVGPTVQEDLVSILLRFRQHRYVISADICKMYRQILIAEEDKPLQLILWRANAEEQLQTFSLNTVVYGTASAPFLATRCLLQLSIDHKDSHPYASEVIKRDFYVDDLLSGADTINDLIEICRQTQLILASAGFELRKWKSNTPDVLNSIKASCLTNDAFYFASSDTCKTLGMLWSSSTDYFCFHIDVSSDQTNITKRIILSDVAKIFDPLGLLNPIVVRAKILLQSLWLLNISWDDQVSADIANKWLSFRSELSDLNTLTIPRHVSCKSPVRVELHGFSDASQHAYGACIYVRVTNETQNVYIQLLCSKSRVAPLKSISIPRLELCAALLLSKLFDKVTSSLTLQLDQCHFWCDSTIALSWIRSSPHIFQVFVGNRISEIQKLTSTESWRYVQSEKNPADFLSRGAAPRQLLTHSEWFGGPLWLYESSVHWPNDITKSKPLEVNDLPEIRKTIQTFVYNHKPNSLFPFNKFSSFNRIKRVTGYCLRFIQNCKTSKSESQLRRSGNLSVEELREAENTLIMISQRESFSQEYHELLKSGRINTKSSILSLNPFLKDSIIRVGGRLKHSQFCFDKKHPMLLSNKHHLTTLILKFEHNKLCHCGPHLLLSNVRERYWPISGKNLAKRVVRECIVCFRFKPKFPKPLMGELPEPRVCPRPPFSDVGVDYAGPFLCKEREGRGVKTYKCYLCLFICLTVKAVHLEIVTSLSTEAFFKAFQRFIARRGKPWNIYSDNGSNFIGASNELKELGNFLKNSKNSIREKLGNSLNIKWNFIPAYSPHQGGIWEASIKSAKRHLFKVLSSSHTILTFESLCTIVYQIENVLNSRPLTPLSSDPNDLCALTPSHFLIGRASDSLPYPDLQAISNNRLSLYQHLENLKQTFWKRWSLEYVSQLQQRHKWKTHQPNVSLGDMVVIQDNDIPPFKWRLGRISAVHPGADGVIRVASVKTSSGIIKRAVAKLAPLPIDPETSSV